MKTITDRIPCPIWSSRAFSLYFDRNDLAVFDIETTGLSPERGRLILSGILLPDEDGVRTIQYFAESPEDEPEVIRNTLDVLRSRHTVLTYNGRSFDIPFLLRRAKHLGMFPEKMRPGSALPVYDLDLLLILRNFSELRNVLPSLSQKEVERYFGIAPERDDQIDGGISIELYQRYLISKDPELERQILLHNHDDIVQLYRLLPILRSVRLHEAMFAMGFPAEDSIVRSLKIRKNALEASCRFFTADADYYVFPTETSPYQLKLIADQNLLTIRFPMEQVSPDLWTIDADRILESLAPYSDPLPEGIAELPEFQSGYLIARQGKTIHHAGCALFVRTFLNGFAKKIKQEPSPVPLI